MAAARRNHPHTRQGIEGAQTGAGGLGHLENDPAPDDASPSPPVKDGKAARQMRRPPKFMPLKAKPRKH